MRQLSNAYPTTPTADRIQAAVKLSPNDYLYLKRIFPCGYGIYDHVLSHLYRAFIADLREAGIDPDNPDHCAWSVDHPVAERIGELLRRRTARLPSGNAGEGVGSRDESRAAGSIHPKDGDDALVRPDSSSQRSSRVRDEKAAFNLLKNLVA